MRVTREEAGEEEEKTKKEETKKKKEKKYGMDEEFQCTLCELHIEGKNDLNSFNCGCQNWTGPVSDAGVLCRDSTAC